MSEMMQIVWDQLVQFTERFLFSVLARKLPDELGIVYLGRPNVERGQSQIRLALKSQIEEKFGQGVPIALRE